MLKQMILSSTQSIRHFLAVWSQGDVPQYYKHTRSFKKLCKTVFIQSGLFKNCFSRIRCGQNFSPPTHPISAKEKMLKTYVFLSLLSLWTSVSWHLSKMARAHSSWPWEKEYTKVVRATKWKVNLVTKKENKQAEY